VIVDASPDAATQRTSILDSFGSLFAAPGSDYVAAGQPSTTSQRNIAVDRLWTDVAVFVDDESLPMPDFLAEIMRVYDADTLGAVGGVGGIEAFEATLKGRIDRLARSTIRRYARHFSASREQALPSSVTVPGPVKALGGRRVRDLQGNKMSFRTELVRAARFDEHMLRYGYCEDLDVSLRIGRTHALIKQPRAKIVHEATDVGRVDPAAYFLVRWVNPAYLTEKLFPFDANRRPLLRLLRLARLQAMSAPIAVRNPQERARRRRLFAAADWMIHYIRDGDPATLGPRFETLQRYIFDANRGDAVEDVESIDRWVRLQVLTST
jgi:GT2 family glycosyltransferase